MARFVGHLPLVQLDPTAACIGTHRGQIRSLPFQEWYSYDGHFPNRQHQYEQTAPCFLELEVPRAADLEAEVTAFQASGGAGTANLRLCHHALMLVTGARLPLPALSVAYLVLEGNDLAGDARELVSSTQLRRVGPAERELIVQGSQYRRVVVDEATISQADRVWRRLESSVQYLEPALTALARTTRPGFTPVNEAFHLIAGLEEVLVIRGEPLAATFARRYSVLATDRDSRSMLPYGKYLYALRSDLVHGHPLHRVTPEWERFLRHSHRHWTCLILRRILCWLEATGAGIVELRAELDRAWETPAELAAFRARSGIPDE